MRFWTRIVALLIYNVLLAQGQLYSFDSNMQYVYKLHIDNLF